MKLRNISSPQRLAAIAVFSIAVATVATPASARPRHHTAHHAHSIHHTHHHYRHLSHHARWNAFRARAARSGADNAYASMGNSSEGFGFGGGSSVVAEARRYLGGNPTGRSRLWCARFMNFVLQRTGHRGTGSDMASSFAHYGQRVSGPEVGAIAVMSR
ncbi:MAG: TIGR02594 family protein, partial [Xanthobacteraceae bacterium]|nr:TIGR02594 family protein [Xanthobacteraceae bacterium]